MGLTKSGLLISLHGRVGFMNVPSAVAGSMAESALGGLGSKETMLEKRTVRGCLEVTRRFLGGVAMVQQQQLLGWLGGAGATRRSYATRTMAMGRDRR
jgi:hypothetical protein